MPIIFKNPRIIYKDKVVFKEIKNPLNKFSLFIIIILIGVICLLSAGCSTNTGAGINNPGVSYLSQLRDTSVAGVTAGQVLGYSASGYWKATTSIASSATWGSITGTLSAQTDLQLALNAKLNKSASSSLTAFYLSATSPYIAKWNQWQQASTSVKGWTDFTNTATGLTYNNGTGATSWASGYEGFTTAFKDRMNSFKAASTSLPYISSSLTANSYVIGNATGVAEATTTINLLTKAFAVASSTYFFSVGSSTIPLGYQFYNDTWLSIACKFIGGSSPTAHIVCGDGTNNMNTLNITGTMASTTLSTNNLLQYKDQAQCVLEAVANSPDVLTCNITYRRN